jgi:hypothetical protein
VTIKLGQLVVGPDHEPALGHVTAVRHWRALAGKETSFVIRSPPPPIRVEIRVSPTFSPHDYGASDQRQLGVQASFGFSVSKPK